MGLNPWVPTKPVLILMEKKIILTEFEFRCWYFLTPVNIKGGDEGIIWGQGEGKDCNPHLPHPIVIPTFGRGKEQGISP